MNIRVMNIQDYDGFLTLWKSCKGMGLNSIDDSREGIERFIKRNPATSYVAQEDNEIIGAILVGHDGRRGYIYHMAVSPAYRRRGIAKKLLGSAMAALKDEGIIKAGMVAFRDNEAGVSFWKSVGFPEREDLIYASKFTYDVGDITLK